MTEIVPAILTNDVNDFRKQVAELLPLAHDFSKLHIDFADNRFVKGHTILPADIHFPKNTKIIWMAHLMVHHPQNFFDDCKRAGFSWVLFHCETFKSNLDLEAAIHQAEKKVLSVGLVLNPETPLTKIAKFIRHVKLIQLMGVHPGAQGRGFIASTIDKVKELRSLSKHVIISVDGGVKVGIAKQLAHAGVDIIVVGSAITKSHNEEHAIKALKKDIET